MIAMKKFSIKALLATAMLACACSVPAVAAEVSGIKFEDTTKLAGKELKLNGLGIRTKFFVKVYAAGMYLPEKAKTAEDVLKMDGPRRVTLIMMRDISSDEFGSAFMAGLNNNVSKEDKSKIVTQISKFGEMFATFEQIKKGDVLHLDWIPGSGTRCELNGKKVADIASDIVFYNAVMRIWLGEKPVDSSLKPALLGGKERH